MARLSILVTLLLTSITATHALAVPVAVPADAAAPVSPASVLNKPGLLHMQCHDIYCDSRSAVNPQCVIHGCGPCSHRNTCANVDEL
jgi:hypothetical protein